MRWSILLCVRERASILQKKEGGRDGRSYCVITHRCVWQSRESGGLCAACILVSALSCIIPAPENLWLRFGTRLFILHIEDAYFRNLILYAHGEKVHAVCCCCCCCGAISPRRTCVPKWEAAKRPLFIGRELIFSHQFPQNSCLPNHHNNYSLLFVLVKIVVTFARKKHPCSSELGRCSTKQLAQ